MPSGPLRQWHTTDLYGRPEYHFRVAVFADHLRVYRAGIELQGMSECFAEPRGIEHSARADHARRWQPGGFGDYAREHVDGIRDHYDHATGRGELLSKLAGELRVVAKQGEARFAGLAAASGRDDDRVGVDHLGDGRRAHRGGGVERTPLREVHRFAFGNLAARVVQQEFVGYAQMQR